MSVYGGYGDDPYDPYSYGGQTWKQTAHVDLEPSGKPIDTQYVGSDAEGFAVLNRYQNGVITLTVRGPEKPGKPTPEPEVASHFRWDAWEQMHYDCKVCGQVHSPPPPKTSFMPPPPSRPPTQPQPQQQQPQPQTATGGSPQGPGATRQALEQLDKDITVDNGLKAPCMCMRFREYNGES